MVLGMVAEGRVKTAVTAGHDHGVVKVAMIQTVAITVVG